MEQALQVAQAAGFQQAVARGHYLAGNFLQALHCAIHATSTPGLLSPTLAQVMLARHVCYVMFCSVGCCATLVVG